MALLGNGCGNAKEAPVKPGQLKQDLRQITLMVRRPMNSDHIHSFTTGQFLRPENPNSGKCRSFPSGRNQWPLEELYKPLPVSTVVISVSRN